MKCENCGREFGPHEEGLCFICMAQRVPLVPWTASRALTDAERDHITRFGVMKEQHPSSLVASHADFVKVCQERDQAVKDRDALAWQAEQACKAQEQAQSERDAAFRKSSALREELDSVYREKAEIKNELEELRALLGRLAEGHQ